MLAQLLQSELWPAVGIPLLIFMARIVDVSLGTMRILLISRGHRALAPLVGFLEVLIWLTALGQVMQHLDRPQSFVAYAAGYAAGTWVGLLIDSKLALGLLAVRVITDDAAEELIGALRDSRFGVTSVAARGISGKVRLIFTVVRRRDAERLLRLLRSVDPDAFVSVSDVSLASEGYFSPPTRGLTGLLQWSGRR